MVSFIHNHGGRAISVREHSVLDLLAEGGGGYLCEVCNGQNAIVNMKLKPGTVQETITIAENVPS